MTITMRFDQEVKNLLYADDGNPLHTCMHCAACTASCPAAPFMDHTPLDSIILRLLLMM